MVPMSVLFYVTPNPVLIIRFNLAGSILKLHEGCQIVEDLSQSAPEKGCTSTLHPKPQAPSPNLTLSSKTLCPQLEDSRMHSSCPGQSFGKPLGEATRSTRHAKEVKGNWGS